ncbi:7456_t:CDS:2, partial [Scutellospora calospora]
MGRSNNVGNMVDSSLSSSNVRIATPSTFPSVQDQIQPFTPTIDKSPNSMSNINPINSFNFINRQTSTTPTTTNIILDYLLYLSINARLEHTKNDLQEIPEEQLQFAKLYHKKGQDVKQIVEGLLQSHRIHASSLRLPLSLKHRLYLCQLLYLVFDRSILSSTPLKSTRVQNSSTIPTRSQSPTSQSLLSSATINLSQKQRAHKLPANLLKYEKHFKNPLLSRCRKHRLSICNTCLQHPNNSSTIPPWSRRRATPPKPIPSCKTAPGLIDAIPVFITTSVITYRIANEQQMDFDHNDSSLVKPL